jgi:hypothetical protein
MNESNGPEVYLRGGSRRRHANLLSC